MFGNSNLNFIFNHIVRTCGLLPHRRHQVTPSKGAFTRSKSNCESENFIGHGRIHLNVTSLSTSVIAPCVRINVAVQFVFKASW